MSTVINNYDVVSVQVAVRCRSFVCESALGVEIQQANKNSYDVKLFGEAKASKFPYACWSSRINSSYMSSEDEPKAEKMQLVNQERFYQEYGYRVLTDLLNRTAPVVLVAYGHSGSGKTYTLFGDETTDQQEAWYKHSGPDIQWGVFPRLAFELFKSNQKDWKISIKYFQNIADVVRDLLSAEKEEQHVENGLGPDHLGLMNVEWCKSITVNTWEDFLQLMKAASGRKETAATQYCHNSTRGHCFLILDIERPLMGLAHLVQHSRLYVCDLAALKPPGDLLVSTHEKVNLPDGSCEYINTGPVPRAEFNRLLQTQAKRINSSLTEFAQFVTMTAAQSEKLGPGKAAAGSNYFFLSKFLKKALMCARTYMVCTIQPELSNEAFNQDTLKLAKTALSLSLKAQNISGSGQAKKADDGATTKSPAKPAPQEPPVTVKSAPLPEDGKKDAAKVGSESKPVVAPSAEAAPAATAAKIQETPPAAAMPVAAAAVPPPVTPAAAPAVQPSEKDEDAALLAQALQQGSKKWKRSKFSLLGQGRAGKTAFANAIAGRQFEETASTVGINQLTCDVKHIQTAGGGEEGEPIWGECTKSVREYEAALAEILAKNKRKAKAKGPKKPAQDKKGKGGDIRAYMESVNETPAPSAEEQALQAPEHDTSSSTEAHGPSLTSHDATSSMPAAHASSVLKPVAPTAGADKPASPRPVPGRPMQPTLPASHQPAASKPAPSRPRVRTGPAKPELDEEMVMKMLATMKDAESGLLISLFDFGGQSVFEVIHHLFLTRNGVYALVFNMEWMLTDGPDKERALRFMRGWLSSIAVHTFNKTTQMTAPIVIVGTRLDTVTSPAAHEKISTLLHEHFSDNLAWRSVVGNEEGRDSNGRAFQWFFPVDNKLGKKGAAMKHLMSVVSGVIDKAEYTHKEVPLTWFKAIDQMADTKKDCLSLEEVGVTADRCDVSEKEVPLLLSFLHDMGHLMWLDEPGLRDVVILDPVSYLVVPATIIICKLTPDNEDSTHHFMESHRECERMHKREWMLLKHEGVLSVKLLPILWASYQLQSLALQMLMVKFGLLVPLRSDASGPVTQYLVPTLLAPAPPNDPNIVIWTDAAFSSCYFVFTLSEELGQSSTVTEADLRSAGFLPGGMFERIVGKALSWSQDTAVGSTVDMHSVLLHKDLAVLAFGRQRFRLVHCADIHCVRVDVEGQNPIGVQQKLQDFIKRIIEECMKSLLCFCAVPFHSTVGDSSGTKPGLCKTLLANELLIPLQQLRKASKGESMLAWRGGRTLITLPEIKSKYGQWLQLYDLRERYDVFLSYRWGRYDSEFTEQLFDMFTNLSVGAQSRAVEVFLDRKRLQEGRLFKSDFAAALTHTLVVVPVVSVDALGRMVEHDPLQSDNVLLEWIMILESFAAGKILKVFPILFGVRKPDDALSSGMGSEGVTITDFFAEKIKDHLPKIAPTATLSQAAELLRANGIQPSQKMHSHTVHSVVNELLQFLLCKASDFAARQLVGGFADKVVRVLNDCGDAALASVCSPAAEPAKPAAAAKAGTAAPSSPHPTAPAAAQGNRDLKSLTVEEVGVLLTKLKLQKLVPIFAANEVTGNILFFCEEFGDLMAEEVGVTSKPAAKVLMEKIKHWTEHGVSEL